MPLISAELILLEANTFGDMSDDNGKNNLSYVIMPLFVLLFIPYIVFFSSGFVM